MLRCVEMWCSPDVELGEFARVTQETAFAAGVGQTTTDLSSYKVNLQGWLNSTDQPA